MSYKRRTNKKKRSVRKRLLILCEGQTERNYFLAMRESEEYKSKMAATNIDIITAKSPTPQEIVDEAIKKRDAAQRENNAYEEKGGIWLVFDHDANAHRETAYQAALKADFNVAFSAICFEYWYLLHFKKTAKKYAKAGELITELKKHYPNYQKAKQNDFENLKPNLATAIANADWLRNLPADTPIQNYTDKNPCMDVDKLIIYLGEL